MADGHVQIVVHNTMGAALIGVICAAVLYGVSCVQTWYFFSRSSRDTWYIKLLVAAVWFFDSVHQALISHTVYHYVISNYANPAMLANIIWSILLEVLFNGFTCLLVQGFLAMRVWRLSNKNILLTGVVVCLILAEFACSVAFTIQSMQLDTWVELNQLKGLSMTVNILAAAGDVLIAATLCIMLHRSRTGFKRSDTMISRLILFTVNTGLLTSICAVASLVSIVVWPTTLIYAAWYFSLGRLYSNSLLATLNARESIRGTMDDTEGLTLSFPNLTKSGSHNLNTKPQHTNISIKIDTTQELTRDQADETLDTPSTDASSQEK